jgi:hypothetical protein
MALFWAPMGLTTMVKAMMATEALGRWLQVG